MSTPYRKVPRTVVPHAIPLKRSIIVPTGVYLEDFVGVELEITKHCTYCGNKEPNCRCGKEEYI